MTSGNYKAPDADWPTLHLAEWQDTRDTLHMWTQIVGKVRLALSPHLNHWWQATFYVTPRGLSTSPIPHHGGMFECEFDFLEHVLAIRTSRGQVAVLPLVSRMVADFYREFFDRLRTLGIDAAIWPMAVEVPNPIRLDEDRVHRSYDPAYARRFWQVLVNVDTVLKEFRSTFIGKASPVHLFWGGLDMAATRFSGRPAPPRDGADAVTQEAYSHEVISAGFWTGGGGVDDAAFYAYAAPEPGGFRDAVVRPESAFYHGTLKEFVLPYEDVRQSFSPSATLLEFVESTYEAGATLGHWDRQALERHVAVAV
jgi:hypothetical protein